MRLTRCARIRIWKHWRKWINRYSIQILGISLSILLSARRSLLILIKWKKFYGTDSNSIRFVLCFSSSPLAYLQRRSWSTSRFISIAEFNFVCRYAYMRNMIGSLKRPKLKTGRRRRIWEAVKSKMNAYSYRTVVRMHFYDPVVLWHRRIFFRSILVFLANEHFSHIRLVLVIGCWFIYFILHCIRCRLG